MKRKARFITIVSNKPQTISPLESRLLRTEEEKIRSGIASPLTPLMLSQHSRSQALVKEEGCDRCGEPTLNLAILMEMKPKRFTCLNLDGFCWVSTLAYPNLFGT